MAKSNGTMYLPAALTIFLSAFLLFQVQPLIGKYILPWFGGTPAVWSACMLFFQVLLLIGYGYAHLIAGRLSLRGQGWLHLILLGAALLVLPITPSEAWKPSPADDPTWGILALLTVTVGGPYLLLSSTGPLLQSWCSRAQPGRSPYRLYALSNAGSLLGLLTYPFLVEPFLRLRTQTWIWSAAFGLFALLCAACACRLLAIARNRDREGRPVADAGPAADRDQGAPPAWFHVAMWLCLAACGSVLLLATTNQMCQDVAVVPFLWVLPLCLYLLSFIICFDNERWYVRRWFAMALLLGVFLSSMLLLEAAKVGLVGQIAVYCFTMFTGCMCCHGELVRTKPAPRHLTLFYLTVAAGGALGGVFVTLVAPHIFEGFWEYHAGLIGCCLLILLTGGRDFLRALAEQRRMGTRSRERALAWATGIAACVAVVTLVGTLGYDVFLDRRDVVVMRRNFYGVLRVSDENADDPDRRRMSMTHGRILHGFQFQADKKRDRATCYYGPGSGIELAIRHHPRRGNPGGGLRIGVVGLGTGTIAAYAGRGDRIYFYEINPDVVELSQQYFSFRRDAAARGAEVVVFLGDARIVMERQLARGESLGFDVLAVDAFSSDAIPIHLLTRECFAVYWRHLKPDGILAVHISNNWLDLAPVVRKLAGVCGKQACPINTLGDEDAGTKPSQWVLLTGNRRFLGSPPVGQVCRGWPDHAPEPLLWTDDFSSLYRLIK